MPVPSHPYGLLNATGISAIDFASGGREGIFLFRLRVIDPDYRSGGTCSSLLPLPPRSPVPVHRESDTYWTNKYCCLSYSLHSASFFRRQLAFFFSSFVVLAFLCNGGCFGFFFRFFFSSCPRPAAPVSGRRHSGCANVRSPYDCPMPPRPISNRFSRPQKNLLGDFVGWLANNGASPCRRGDAMPASAR